MVHYVVLLKSMIAHGDVVFLGTLPLYLKYVMRLSGVPVIVERSNADGDYVTADVLPCLL